MKILQVNSVVNVGSTGRIAEMIGLRIIKNGGESFIAFGRRAGTSSSYLIRIGKLIDLVVQAMLTRVFDKHGYGSKRATRKFIKVVSKLSPDIIHLHNVHGYYINLRILFEYLAKINIPVVWTLHDCWAFTGHCAYFSYINCNKWQTHCDNCPQISSYPTSLVDNSFNNFELKKQLFNNLDNLTIIPVSQWLKGKVKQSFLRNHRCIQIYNGINLDVFKPLDSNCSSVYDFQNNFIILGVASPWTKRKGFNEFLMLSNLLNDDELIVLIGLSKSQIKVLPENIIGLTKTDSVESLVIYYNRADVFVNPTLEDNFPTTNLEALACGTPVITYNTGGSVEAVNDETGVVARTNDAQGLRNAIDYIKQRAKQAYREKCRNYAILNFGEESKYDEYIDLYRMILNNKK